MTLELAAEAFAQIHLRDRARFRAAHLRRVGDLFVVEDDDQIRDPRKTQVICGNLPADRVVRQIEAAGIGWHFVCAFHDPAGFDRERRAYKDQGYRALNNFRVFAHDLRLNPTTTNSSVRIVENESMVPAQKRRSRKRPSGEDVRQFVVVQAERIVGRVQSIEIRGVNKIGWVSDLFVEPECRRQGLGRVLMEALLVSDKALGLSSSLLLASVEGAKLYPTLGYEDIGFVQVFCPTIRR